MLPDIGTWWWWVPELAGELGGIRNTGRELFQIVSTHVDSAGDPWIELRGDESGVIEVCMLEFNTEFRKVLVS